MSNSAKVIIGVAVIAVVVWAMAVGIKGPETDEGPIKIGFIGPLTGDAASYGESELKAVQIAVEEINNAGGIGGEMVELVVEDGKCDPQQGGTAAQKLVNIDKVKVIIGGACSGETLAAAAITEPAKIILISPSASSPKVSTAGDFVFRTYPSDALAGKVAATYAYQKLNARKAAVISELTDYAQGLREVYKKTFADLGGQVVSDETYTTGETDFRTQIAKIKAAKPDAIYVVPQSPTPGIAIFRQLRENKVAGHYTTAEVLLDRQILKDNAQVLEGLIGVESSPDYEKNVKAKAFRDSHKAKFGADPGAFAVNAYDATYLVAQAIRASGLDTVKIQAYLAAVKDYDGAAGKITMDANGDPILGENVVRYEKGEIKTLEVFTP